MLGRRDLADGGRDLGAGLAEAPRDRILLVRGRAQGVGRGAERCARLLHALEKPDEAADGVAHRDEERARLARADRADVAREIALRHAPRGVRRVADRPRDRARDEQRDHDHRKHGDDGDRDDRTLLLGGGREDLVELLRDADRPAEALDARPRTERGLPRGVGAAAARGASVDGTLKVRREIRAQFGAHRVGGGRIGARRRRQHHVAREHRRADGLARGAEACVVGDDRVDVRWIDRDDHESDEIGSAQQGSDDLGPRAHALGREFWPREDGRLRAERLREGASERR